MREEQEDMGERRTMPVEGGLDHSIALLKEGYHFILNRRDRYDTNVFKTKLLAQDAICLSGKESATLFYDTNYFRRSDAAPKRLKKTLFGQGGVQGLDGEEHRHRKAMFMSLMTKDALEEISNITKKQWKQAAKNWESEKEIILYEEAKQVMTKVACAWTGVPLPERDLAKRAEQLADMFESAAAIGPKHWKGRKARASAEKWIEDLIENVRNEQLAVSPDRALYTFSWHKDLEGNLLDKKTVAVELLNLLRPIVAIAVYVCLTGLAIHQFPNVVAKLESGKDKDHQWFIQEVRRFYPFFPFAAARVKKDFTWNGFSFEEGTLTLLDLYGTNHDPKIWENPYSFQPERFHEWKGSPFDFIPQGGGEFDLGHRCAGEWITLDIMKVSLKFLIHQIDYEVPKQDLSLSMVKMPSLPESKLVIKNIKCV